METSVLNRIDWRTGFAAVVGSLILVIVPAEAEAEILFQTNNGVWVNGLHFAHGAQTMPGIVLVPEARGASGFMSQRALAWSTYKRGDGSTGFMLVDPAGSGMLSATSPRQANARSHAARANAYRLEYFKK